MYSPIPTSILLFERKDKLKIEGELTFPKYSYQTFCETLLRYLGIRLAQQYQQVWVNYNAPGFNVHK